MNTVVSKIRWCVGEHGLAETLNALADDFPAYAIELRKIVDDVEEDARRLVGKGGVVPKAFA